MADRPRHRVPAGIHEWEGAEAAVEYAETLRVVLEPWVQKASFAYRVIEGHSPDDYRGGATVAESLRTGVAWWLPGSKYGPSW
jgi:hypothetical protein